jgi:(1->4)-alpha-D-glucan 1-alpha-D-glucosylmutase
VPETLKLWLIVRALTLRAHRPEAFAGAYAPLAAGPDTVAFLRGDSVLAAAELRVSDAPVTVPEGTWRDVLMGGERRLAGPIPAADLLGEHGIALLQRV